MAVKAELLTVGASHLKRSLKAQISVIDLSPSYVINEN